MATIELLGEQCTLLECIGSGGMGSVFGAEHPREGRLAVKLLQPELCADPLLVARMADEAAAGQRVDHPNVVRLVGAGVSSEGVPFVAMRHVRGVSLGHRLQCGPLGLASVRAIALQVLSGLDAIHRAGLVHADLKCDNILVDSSDRATIIDFGLARPPHTRLRDDEKIISGTPDYMAPELIRGEAITPAADIYAMGVILYELVTGTTPFGGGTTTEIFHRQLDDDVVAPSLRCTGVTIPRALDTVIVAALAKNPEDRPPTALILRALVARAISPTWSDEQRAWVRHVMTTGPTQRWPRGSLPIDNVRVDDDPSEAEPGLRTARAG